MSKIAAGVQINNNHIEVYEDVYFVASKSNNRRVDIFAVDHSKKLGYIQDPTVRFETYDEQPLDVDMEKKTNLLTYFWLF